MRKNVIKIIKYLNKWEKIRDEKRCDKNDKIFKWMRREK